MVLIQRDDAWSEQGTRCCLSGGSGFATDLGAVKEVGNGSLSSALGVPSIRHLHVWRGCRQTIVFWAAIKVPVLIASYGYVL